MALPPPLHSIFQYIDQNQQNFLDRLDNALKIASVPSKQNLDEINEMINWTKTFLESYGVKTELKNIEDDRYNGSFPLPPVLCGTLETGTCPNKATVLIYGNLDVVRSKKEDGWLDEPFGLYKEYDYIVGRGVIDKSGVVSWLNALEAYAATGNDYPVNLKFIFESMETKDSPGLKNLLLAEKEKFLASVDYVCVTKGSWLLPEMPSIVSSFRGICCFSIEVESAPKNLNFNITAGLIHDAMTDIIFLLKSLTDADGNFNVTLLNLETVPIMEEYDICANLNIDLKSYLQTVSANSLCLNGDWPKILKNRWIHPTLTIHGIETSCIEITEKEIPGIVVAKLSIRTVHNQDPEKVFELVKTYLEDVWKNMASENKLNIFYGNSIPAWKADVNNNHHKAGAKALSLVYEKEPYYLPSGYVIPVVRMLEELTERNVLVIPVGSGGKYDVNENFALENFNKSAKVRVVYLYEMGELPRIHTKSSASFVSCKSMAEICVCGKFGREIKASGDSEKCLCPSTVKQAQVDKSCMCSPKALLDNEEQIIAVQTMDELKIQPKKPINCTCLLTAKPPTDKIEILSMDSNISSTSKDPTPILSPVIENIELSIETINCTCIPLKYRRKAEKFLTPQRQVELMKSMRSFGSELTGKSACVSVENAQIVKMKMLGCVCAEKSMETIFELDRQRDRMTCPVTVAEEGKICNKGGRRKHHVKGPPPVDGDDGELSLGPLSHCSCPSDESIEIIPNCDCPEADPRIYENLENEVD